MVKKILFGLVLMNICVVLNAQDSLTQKNKELIDQLKERINKIETKATKDPVAETEKLIALLKAKTDSINLLLTELKKIKDNSTEANKNYSVISGNNFLTFLFNTKETKFDYSSAAELDAFMKNYDGKKKIIIKGHADKTGAEINNIKFSMQRAKNLESYIIKQYGIDPKRIKTIWHGSEVPLPNTNETPHLNRRVEISFS